MGEIINIGGSYEEVRNTKLAQSIKVDMARPGSDTTIVVMSVPPLPSGVTPLMESYQTLLDEIYSLSGIRRDPPLDPRP